MKIDINENNFLAKWLSGDLSKEDQQAFESTEDHLAYKDILKGVDRFDKPIFDIEEKLKEQKDFNATYKGHQKSRVIKPMTWLYSAAATIVLLIGLKALFFQDITTVYTKNGQMDVITLPDHSVVHLNADSSLKYNEKSFLEDKVLQLQGEAFFEVKKGASFVVNTKNGKVTVLGTAFNLYARDQTFEVHCYEGKVSVQKGEQEVILTPGKGAKYIPKEGFSVVEISNPQPDWLQGKSSFSEVPLGRLIQELERQYNIKIRTESIDLNRVFTGFFTHNNLKTALKTSFDPMNIGYVFDGKGLIVLKNK